MSRPWAIVLVLATAVVPGCWSRVRAPAPPLPFVRPAPEAPPVAVYVNEVGVPFTDGTLGNEVRNALMRTGAFREVQHPVVPAAPGTAPALAIEVRASGEVNEAILWNFPMALATAYFFLLPAPVLPYFTTFEAACEVSISREDRELARFRSESSATATYAIGANRFEYGRDARATLFRALANDVAERAAKIASNEAQAPPATP